MFRSITRTWNPFSGCLFSCSYCWARKLAETRHKASYPNGFTPESHPDRYAKHFKLGEFVFVSSMGDIAFAPISTWLAIHDNIANHPETLFLFCTKSPHIYRSSLFDGNNVFHGVTLETNRLTPMSKAPSPLQRYQIMTLDKHPRKFISIEPIMDFDLVEFSQWIYDINPEIVEIGADNWRCNLPEPSGDKVRNLIEILILHGVTVVQKQGLERLLKRSEDE